jgi:molybdopterin synthase catalytic subunit
MISLISDEIDPATAYTLIDTKGSGSVVFHYAVVKSMAGTDGATSYIDYSANAAAEAELQQIADDLVKAYTLQDILLIRRTGRLVVGDIISLIAASSPASDDAFEACKQGIARLKKMKTIVKHEVCS